MNTFGRTVLIGADGIVAKTMSIGKNDIFYFIFYIHDNRRWTTCTIDAKGFQTFHFERLGSTKEVERMRFGRPKYGMLIDFNTIAYRT